MPRPPAKKPRTQLSPAQPADPNVMATCWGCQHSKPEPEFVTEFKGRPALLSLCRECVNYSPETQAKARGPYRKRSRTPRISSVTVPPAQKVGEFERFYIRALIEA